jgi:hypothetical protein
MAKKREDPCSSQTRQERNLLSHKRARREQDAEEKQAIREIDRNGKRQRQKRSTSEQEYTVDLYGNY